MTIPLRCLIAVGAVACVLGTPQGATAQLDQLPYMLKYNNGQNVQPVFQGWSRNPDGSFEMHLGYLNRNYLEELHIPIGPDNNIEPGGPDQGQPTYFYTRANRQIFSVTVPADFGNKEVVWTLTVRGKTERAVGWLQPEWEIDVTTGGRQQGEEARRNQPPLIGVNTPPAVRLPATVTLTTTVTDDGLPTPRGRRQFQRNRAIGQEIPPILMPPEGSPEPPKNLPGLNVNNRGAQQRARPPEGLTVSYIVWRGPEGVDFESDFATVEGDTATTTATFSKPGTYVLRVRGHDGGKSTYDFLTVTTRAPASASQP